MPDEPIQTLPPDEKPEEKPEEKKEEPTSAEPQSSNPPIPSEPSTSLTEETPAIPPETPVETPVPAEEQPKVPEPQPENPPQQPQSPLPTEASAKEGESPQPEEPKSEETKSAEEQKPEEEKPPEGKPIEEPSQQEIKLVDVEEKIQERLKTEQDERRKLANEARAKKKEDNLNKILEFSKEKKLFSNDNIRDLLHVSQSTATNYLSELTKRGLIKREGKRGGAKYSG